MLIINHHAQHKSVSKSDVQRPYILRKHSQPRERDIPVLQSKEHRAGKIGQRIKVIASNIRLMT